MCTFVVNQQDFNKFYLNCIGMESEYLISKVNDECVWGNNFYCNLFDEERHSHVEISLRPIQQAYKCILDHTQQFQSEPKSLTKKYSHKL